jgi:hypothetical protein
MSFILRILQVVLLGISVIVVLVLAYAAVLWVIRLLADYVSKVNTDYGKWLKTKWPFCLLKRKVKRK